MGLSDRLEAFFRLRRQVFESDNCFFRMHSIHRCFAWNVISFL